MLGAVVEVKGAHLLAPEGTARDHPLDRLLEHALGETTLQHLARGDLFQAAGIAGVLVVDLLVELAAGELHLVGVDDDDMVAAIDVRGVARLVLAPQDVGDDRCDAPDDQAIGVDQVPFLFDLGRLGRFGRLHQRLHGV